MIMYKYLLDNAKLRHLDKKNNADTSRIIKRHQKQTCISQNYLLDQSKKQIMMYELQKYKLSKEKIIFD